MTVCPVNSATDMDSVIERSAKPLKEVAPLRTHSSEKVCFVCTGNTCRSPMAAAVTNDLFKDKGISAVSAGLYPETGHPISENALKALHGKGIIPSAGNQFDLHRAHGIDEKLISECDLICAISKSHMLSLIMAYPSYAGKITVMPSDISDPYGGDINTYTKCLEEIIMGVKELFGFGTDKGSTL